MATLLFLAALVLVAVVVWFSTGSSTETDGPQNRRVPAGSNTQRTGTDMELAGEIGAAPGLEPSRPFPVPAPNTSPEGGETAEEGLVALVRNPQSLYIYWEPSSGADSRLREMLGDDEWQRTTPCLRVFDVTSGKYPDMRSGHLFELVLREHDDHAFIQGLTPGRRYVVSQDRKTPEGRYYMVQHSDPVVMPADGPEGVSPLYQMYGRQPGSWSGSPRR